MSEFYNQSAVNSFLEQNSFSACYGGSNITHVNLSQVGFPSNYSYTSYVHIPSYGNYRPSSYSRGHSRRCNGSSCSL